MKKQMTILAAAAILATFATAAIAAVPAITMTGGFAYAVEYNLLDRTWTDPADGVLNTAASVAFSVGTTSVPSLGTITLTNVLTGTPGVTATGVVKGFDVALGSVNADWDTMSGNTGNPGATLAKTMGGVSLKVATTGAIVTPAAAATLAVPAVPAVPGVADVTGVLVSYTGAVPAGGVVIHPYIPAVAAKPAMPATQAQWDTVNGFRASVALGSASVYGGLVLDPAWVGLGYVGASSKVGPATVSAKAGKLLGTGGGATALFAKAELPVNANLNLLAKVAIAPNTYAYAHINSAASGTGDDSVDMETLGWVAGQADRNLPGKPNVYVKANLTVNPNVMPFGSFDYSANGDFIAKAGTSFKTLYVNEASVALTVPAVGVGNTEFYVGLGKGIVSAFVGYKITGAVSDTKAEVKVATSFDWLSTWASVGKAYAATTPYIKVGASAGATF